MRRSPSCRSASPLRRSASLLRRSGSPLALTATLAATAVVVLLAGSPLAAQAAEGFPSDTSTPDLNALLAGYSDFWTSNGTNDLHGTVVDPSVLTQNDELAVWINTNATKAQQFRALQDSEYQNADGTAYDQSVTVATALGSVLGPLYTEGRQNGALPLTSALINSSNGTSGAYVSTSVPKAAFSYPRPFLPSDPAATPISGDAPECAPTIVNASSLQPNRTGKPYADETGDLDIVRVPDAVDTTHEFSPNDVALSAAYGSAGICTGGSYPSGHTTTAYEAGIALATLLPELAPELLARASEAGNDRIVLGVHYPLDIMGGRIDGEAALAARWSDEQYRTAVLEPARQELVTYLEKQCGDTLTACIATSTAYQSNPYGGAAIPGGTSQIVTDRASAVSVFTERMTYGFAQTGTTGLAASVPDGASNLLLTTFPTLTDAQRTSVLGQTEIASGYPLDLSGTAGGSWQRLDLAAATSATVEVETDGSDVVTSTGGAATVVAAQPPVTPTATPTPTPTTPAATTTPTSAPAAGGSGSGSGSAAGGSGSGGSLASTGSDAASVAPWSAGVLALGLVLAVAAGLRRRHAKR